MKKYLDKYNRLSKFFLVGIVSISLFYSFDVDAASISLVPSSGSVSVGNIVSVKITTNTGGKAINNAEATIQFPTDLLEVISVNKVPSIFTLWVEEPSFSNSLGSISLNGGVSNPGYTGSSGGIATITFKAKKQGNASVLFADASVRENDGLGTDILTSKNSATIQIGAVKEEPIEPVLPKEAPATLTSSVPKPIITSSTNPNQELWYSNTTASFSWKIPTGVTSLQTLFNKTANSTPTIKYDNSVTEKTLSNISNGTFYFHLRYANGATFGPVSHFKVNIDNTAPNLTSTSIRQSNNVDYLTLNATDSMSGVDHYNILTDKNEVITVKESSLVNSEYKLLGFPEGSHNLTVTAYDKAGNVSSPIVVTLVASKISAPELSISATEITQEDSVVIFGKSDYPNSHVIVIFESNGKEIKNYLENTLSDGTFSFSSGNLKDSGIFKITAVSVVSENLISKPSKELFLKINEREVIKITRTILGIVIVCILLLILLIALYAGWHKFFGLRRKINDKLRDTLKDVHRATSELKDELGDQLDILEKIKEDRDLNKKEKEIFNEIKKNINTLDEFIEKKLKKLM